MPQRIPHGLSRCSTKIFLCDFSWLISFSFQKRIRVDFNRSSLERNFITPSRAMSDFLLKPTDLESLVKTRRRSPHAAEPPITVYWRKDVEAKAIEVWGSRENLLRECLKREIEKKTHQQSKSLPQFPSLLAAFISSLPQNPPQMSSRSNGDSGTTGGRLAAGRA